MKFSTLIESTVAIDGGLALDVPADWMQGRSTFGGLQAALAVRAMRAHVDAAIPLRSLQATFIAPIAGRMHAQATVLRTGKSTTHVEARVMGEDGLAVIAVAVFGKARTSAVAIAPIQPVIERPAKPFVLPYVAGMMPAFIQHFTARWLRGRMGFSGTDQQHVVEIDLDDDAPATEAHAIAMADFIPPLALTMMPRPANGSTTTWLLELLADSFPAPTNWRIDAELMAARDGYTNQSLVLWGPDGSPLALGRQSMIVFG